MHTNLVRAIAFVIAFLALTAQSFAGQSKVHEPKMLSYKNVETPYTADQYFEHVIMYNDLPNIYKDNTTKYQQIILRKMANQMGVRTTDFKVTRRGVTEESPEYAPTFIYETHYGIVCEINIVETNVKGDYKYTTTLC